MACRADWYTRPLRRAFRGREGKAFYALQFNPPVEPEECLLTTLIVVFGSVNTQGPITKTGRLDMPRPKSVPPSSGALMRERGGPIPLASCVFTSTMRMPSITTPALLQP